MGRERAVNIDPDVAAVLARCEVRGSIVILPPGMLERDLYQRVNKVLIALGGKWSRAAKGHVFAHGVGEQLAAALAAGKAVDQKRTMEQFFTPPEIAERMAIFANIKEGHHVLEPSAGSGRLVEQALLRGALVTAVEIDRPLAEQLHETLGAAHHGSLYIFHMDFLEWRPASPIPIDRVIMNPPFSGNQDMLHVRRAFEFLTPGGLLVAIMSPHWTFAEDTASALFRQHMREIGAEVETLPEGSFKGEGTGVNAILVRLWK